MPDRHEKLRGVLKELESELASLDSLDDASRAALEESLQEIIAALRKNEPGVLQRDESLADKLRDAADEFEHSHPTLFGIVTRTIDALGQMGI